MEINKIRTRKKVLLSRLIHLGLLLLLLSGTAPAATPAFANETLQPILRQLAIEEPDLPIEVIVQTYNTETHFEDAIASWGGQITRELSIIHAFAAKLPAKFAPQLAALPGVRWVSFNDRLYKSSVLEDENSLLLREDFDDTDNAISNQSSHPDISPSSTIWSGLGTWSGQAWQEIGESDGPTSGDVAIARFLGGELTGLRLQNGNKGLVGFANLSDVSQAHLSYAYRRKDFDDANDFVEVQISADGGKNWVTLAQYVGPITDDNIQVANFDIATYASANTAIRFLSSPTFDTSDRFYVDFVQIEFVEKPESEKVPQAASNRTFLPLISNTQLQAANQAVNPLKTPSLLVDQPLNQISAAEASTIKSVCDIFDTVAWNSNVGDENWAGNWIENEVTSGGAGAASGHVQVTNSALRFDNYPSTGGQPSAARKANLGNGVGTAVLSIGVFTSSGVDASDAAVIEVSKDGGATYAVLETFTGITGSTYLARNYDVSRFATSNFMVRFRIKSYYSDINEYFSVDFVNVGYERVDSGAAWVVFAQSYADGWHYLDNNSDQGTAWRQPGFNDSGWNSGRSELGYGDADEATYVNFGADPNNKPITTYFRRSFQVSDASQLSSLELWLLADDGAVVYLNGTEVMRQNMPSGSINYTTRASSDIDGAAETTFYNYLVNSSLLVNGENVVAVEVHQFSPTSPDISFNLGVGGWSTCTDCINTTVLNSNYLKSIRAADLWNGTNHLQGQGVTVAVVDSGITPHQDSNSAMLYQRILTHVNFSANQSSPDDANGHGSHVAGIIAGNGSKSHGAYLGVAPHANLVDVKVTDDQGSGTTADVVEGLQWIYENKNAYNIRVANLSLNSTVAESYHTSPLDAALEILWFNGIVVVVSSGNNGTTASGTIYPPANDPFVITVGAVDDKGTPALTDDVVPSFSAYGTTVDGFAKPDLVAPGRNIISLLSSDDSNLVVNHPANAVSGTSGSYYFRMSGTSMASAVATGAVALLIQDEPNLTPDQIKYRLWATANKSWSGYSSQKAGAGTLDIYAAVNGTTTQSKNTNIQASHLLWTGSQPVVWGSVNWNSVNWNSVNWNSVNWNSVNWNSVNWNSVTWD